MSQIWCIWRRDIYGNVVDHRMDHLKTSEIILNCFFDRNVLIFPDIYTNYTFASDLPQPFGDPFSSVIVESKTIDQSFIFRKPEQPRLFVFLLPLISDRSDL